VPRFLEDRLGILVPALLLVIANDQGQT
jgi:hypothetical protein